MGNVMDERRVAAGSRIVIATHNPGKAREFAELFAPYGLVVVSAGEFGLGEPEETETTFEGNARLKAVAAARASGLPALADDSGLEVAVLDGAPGVYSARWAGPGKDFSAAMAKVRHQVMARDAWGDGPRAAFRCVLCVAWPDGVTRVFEGQVDGVLVWPVRGAQGFGYDPMFLPDGERLTFGEMAAVQKHAISHRARAFAAFTTGALDAHQS